MLSGGEAFEVYDLVTEVAELSGDIVKDCRAEKLVVGVLEYQADPAPHLIGGLFAHRQTVDAHFPLRRRNDAFVMVK